MVPNPSGGGMLIPRINRRTRWSGRGRDPCICQRLFRPVTAAFAIPTAITVAACSGSDVGESEPMRSDSAGIEVLTASVRDVALPIRAEVAWTMGGADDERFALTSIGPWAVATDSTRRLYLLDTTGRRVLVIGFDGKFLSQLGGPGEGPGELQDPVAIAGLVEGGIGVIDLGKGRLVRWNASGDVLPEERLGASVVMFPVRFGQNRTYVTVPGHDSAGNSERRLVVENAGRAVLARTTVPGHQATFPICGLSVRVSPLFSPRLIWDARDDLVAVVSDENYRIEIFDSEELVRVITRDLYPQEATKQLAIAAVGNGVPTGDCTIPAEEEVAGRGFAHVVPVIDALVLRSRHEIWVRRWMPSQPALIDVASVAAGYSGTLSPGTPMPTLFLSPFRYITVDTDELGAPLITAYDVLTPGIR